jgi:lipoprotein-releasing system permease protein
LIDQLPVKVNVDELVMTACITLAICLVATLYPAIRAARLPPVEGLRYE